jgi:ATP-dependent DNA helicase RecQ
MFSFRVGPEEADRFGVHRFRPGQRAVIDAVLSGKDVLGIMPTGSGKSLTFQLPALVLRRATLVVTPLISLMQDQTEKALQANIEAAKLNSTLSMVQERETREAIAENNRSLIYVTPERLENLEYRNVPREAGVSLFVVDEAHCISHRGHDFRPAYLSLRDAIRDLARPPVLALTATAPPDIQADIIKQLGLNDPVVVDTGSSAPLFFSRCFAPLMAMPSVGAFSRFWPRQQAQVLSTWQLYELPTNSMIGCAILASMLLATMAN